MKLLTRKIKRAVSGKRSRYKRDGFDLDLTYVTKRIIGEDFIYLFIIGYIYLHVLILFCKYYAAGNRVFLRKKAMGLPSDGVESLYRNKGSDGEIIYFFSYCGFTTELTFFALRRSVARMLNAKHPGRYMIFNLSERSYPYAPFHHMVQELGFADHHNPPLLLLFTLTNSISNWLKSDDKNVAVVHCLAGKGRTGLVISCYLMLCGLFADPAEALAYFRSQRLEGVSSPSQQRYAHYFGKVLKTRQAPYPKRFILSKIFMHNCGVDMARKASDRRLLIEIFELTMDGPNNCRKKLRWACNQHDHASDTTPVKSTDIVSFTLNLPIRGDVLITCRSGGVTYFRIAFHTGFIPLGMLRLTKSEMDENKKLHSQFLVDFVMSPTDQQSSNDGISNSRPIVDEMDPELEADMQRLQTLLETLPRIGEANSNMFDTINPVVSEASCNEDDDCHYESGEDTDDGTSADASDSLNVDTTSENSSHREGAYTEK